MVKKTTLSNGLRVIFIPRPESFAATVLILVEAGSEYETKEINGLSHFLEHMTFKGTVNRPQAGMVASELDGLGAQFNAFTSQEYTGYWAKAQSAKAGRVLDIVSDLYLNPVFNPAEIERERGVVIEEINLYEDTPSRNVQEIFTSLLYGDQPAGWDVAGKKEIIRKVQREDFTKYRGTHYVAPKTVVVVAGSFDEKKAFSHIKKLFGILPRSRVAKKPVTEVPRRKQPAVLLKHKASDQSHLVLGTHAFSIFDKRRYIIELLSDVLGGGMSSRLFHRVRQELGAAYYVHASADLLIDHGHFVISCGVDHLKIKEVIRVILEEMKKLREEKVGKEELQKSKDHVEGNLMLSLEGSDELASFYGGQEILTRSWITPEEFIKKIQAVTAEEVMALTKTLFRESALNLAIIGPYKDASVFRKLLKL